MGVSGWRILTAADGRPGLEGTPQGAARIPACVRIFPVEGKPGGKRE